MFLVPASAAIAAVTVPDTEATCTGVDNAALAPKPAGRPTPAALAPIRELSVWPVSPAPPCNDSMRRWKLDIWAREKRCAVSVCAAINAVTATSWVGSGRPVTVTVTTPCDEATGLLLTP